MSKVQRAASRERRREAERAAAAAASRRRRVQLLGGAGAVAVIAVVVAIVVSAAGGKTDPQPVQTSSATSGLLAGIPESNGVLGKPNAPVTLTEYVDLQCPICAQAAQETMPDIITKYVKTGKVKLRAETMSFIGPDSVRAAKVAAGAAQQGKLWSFLETFYASQGQENSGYVTDDFLTEVANAAGVDAKAALAYADTGASQEPLDAADAAAQAMGVDSTPSFTVKKGDGDEQVVAVGLEDLADKLEKALA